MSDIFAKILMGTIAAGVSPPLRWCGLKCDGAMEHINREGEEK